MNEEQNIFVTQLNRPQTGFNKTGLTTCLVPKASEHASLCELQSREFFEIYLGRIQRACGSHPSLTSGFYHQAGFSAANF